MSILGLQLETQDISQVKAFYVDRLTLPIHRQTPTELSIQIGNSRLSFVQRKSHEPPNYYFSIGLPHTRFSEAITWLNQRIDYISRENNVFHTSDMLGNSISLVPQKLTGLKNTSLVNICGIGMAVEDPRHIATYLQAYLENQQPFVESTNALVLNNEGIEFTFVKHGTPWPIGDISANIFPIIMSVPSSVNGTAKLLNYPYYVYRAVTN